ncbi:MAG: NACHT domain-containing protein, partial [Cyanobacteria bacterium J06632_3]
MGRSLRASKEGLAKAKKAFKLKGWTQEYLAGAAGCSRGTVINFFARRPVAKGLFQAFCVELGLEWGEVAELEADEAPPERTLNIDELIVSVRDNIYDSIVEKCGSMRVLDMSQPIGLDDIYTDVNILEKITGRRRLGIPQLLEQVDIENFERFSLSGIREERVPGLPAVEQYSKLMILGKPGAGKTTFLKHLAIQCMEGRFKPQLVPLFITLKDFAEEPGQPSLREYLTQLFASYDIDSDPQVNEKTSTIPGNYASVVRSFLNQGRVLILLDGLDEVRESDNGRVLQQIQSFTTQFYKNQFIITCRIAAKGYTFEQFTEVEVADFDDGQIESFATKWFQVKKDTVKAETFMERLQQDEGIRELATSPILLTLLCLVFEEAGSFPANRSELYKEGLDVLLKKWDV